MPPSERNNRAGSGNDGNLPQPTPYDPNANQPAAGGFAPPEAPKNDIPDAPPPSREASPYDFFMSEGGGNTTATKGPLGMAVPQSPGRQIALFAGAGVLVLVILGAIMMLAPDDKPKAALITVNQAQLETLRVCNEGQSKAKNRNTKSFSSNCILTMTSSSRELTGYLTKAGANLKGKVLGGGYVKETDERLSKAESASNFDDTYQTVMSEQLTRQARAIARANNDPSTTNLEKSQLAKYAQGTKLLSQQLNQ